VAFWHLHSSSRSIKNEIVTAMAEKNMKSVTWAGTKSQAEELSG